MVEAVIIKGNQAFLVIGEKGEKGVRSVEEVVAGSGGKNDWDVSESKLEIFFGRLRKQ